MKRAFVVGLALAVSIGTVLAQPKKTPPPGAPAGGSGSAIPPKPEQDPKPNLPAGETTSPWAAGVSAEQKAMAFQKFEEANLKLNDGSVKQAVALYREALAHWNHPAIHYNLALALVSLDLPIEIEASLLEAVKYGEAPLEKAQFEHAKEYLLLIQKQIAEVEVSCDKMGAEVLLDGQPLFTVKPGAPNRYAGKVKIGKHTFVAKKTGYNAQIEAPFIGPGENFRINLKLYTSDELTRYKRRFDQKWMPFAVIGGGVALALGGGLMQLSANSSFKEFDDKIARCNADTMGGNRGCMDTSLDDLKKSGNTKRSIGYVGYGVGAGAIAVGALLLYLNREQPYQITADQYIREQENKKSATGGVSVVPVISPEVAGAVVQGRF
ncbi:MAG: hypothetical protein KF773_29835 [Deltaproteobacteria bacterium]|nr:hypothetical protein [Deltaproteobacteria bacterium]